MKNFLLDAFELLGVATFVAALIIWMDFFAHG
jgi:hypothetical protein